MSLMKLTPETVRLRRIAKAFTAGEFTLQEYRSARREVIANFVPTQMDDDDTQPRAAMPEAEQERRNEVSGSQRRLWLLVLVAVGTLLAATGVFAADGQNIAAVAERDPNPATSPRLQVERVYLANFTPLPGVSEHDIESRISQTLSRIRQAHEPGEHGFNDHELEELGKLLNALGAHDPGAELGDKDIADIQALLTTQKRRRGVSVSELEEVAAAVQSLYRDAGYFLATAYVPAQQLDDAAAAIEIVPGVLGSVAVQGDGASVADRFADLVGQVLTEEVVTTRLYALNQAPGLRAQASFEPGDQLGETRLNLEVIPQKRWGGKMSVDNYGDEGTGENRLLGDVSLLNPSGRGDLLEVGMMASLEGADQVFGYLSYATPFAARNHLRTRLAYTGFETDLNGNATDVDGDGWLYDIAFGRSLRQARDRGLSYDLAAGYQRLNWEGDSSYAIDSQDVYFAGAGLDAHRVWDGPRIALDGSLRAEMGTIEGSTFNGQDSSYWLAGIETFAWKPIDLPLFPGDQKFAAEFRGQVTNSQLPSSKRLALGGTMANRAFRRDTYVVDRGALLRLDVRTPVRLGEISLFADAAYGETLNDLDSNWGYLGGFGLAWSLSLANVESRLSWAFPLASNGSGDLDDDGSQVFWSFSYRR